MKRFRVVFLKDTTYAVEEWVQKSDYEDDWRQVHTGSLADCEAFIRLREGGYL